MLLACHSQGVAHARTSLLYLPLEFRSRVRVLALAPAAIFIPADDGIQVVHVYKLEDPVLLAAHGFSMVEFLSFGYSFGGKRTTSHVSLMRRFQRHIGQWFRRCIILRTATLTTHMGTAM